MPIKVHGGTFSDHDFNSIFYRQSDRQLRKWQCIVKSIEANSGPETLDEPPPPRRDDPHVKVAGAPGDVSLAREKIISRLDVKPVNRVTLKMDVSHTDHSHVIGRQGNVIQSVMNESQCHIHFPDCNRANMYEKSNHVTISGGVPGVEIARIRIRELLPLVYQFEVSNNDSQPLSTQSPKIQHIQDAYKVTVIFKQKAPKPVTLVLVRGNVRDAQRVIEATRLIMEHLLGETAAGELVTVQIDIAPQHHVMILGPNGDNVKSIMQQTGVQIQLPDPSNVTPIRRGTIYIIGAPENVYIARQQLVACLPLILQFEMRDEGDPDQKAVDNMAEQMDIHITLKQRNRQTGTRGVVLKTVESNSTRMFDARRLLMGLSPNEAGTEQLHNFIRRNNSLQRAIPPVVASTSATGGLYSASLGVRPPNSNADSSSTGVQCSANADLIMGSNLYAGSKNTGAAPTPPPQRLISPNMAPVVSTKPPPLGGVLSAPPPVSSLSGLIRPPPPPVFAVPPGMPNACPPPPGLVSPLLPLVVPNSAGGIVTPLLTPASCVSGPLSTLATMPNAPFGIMVDPTAGAPSAPGPQPIELLQQQAAVFSELAALGFFPPLPIHAGSQAPPPPPPPPMATAGPLTDSASSASESPGPPPHHNAGGATNIPTTASSSSSSTNLPVSTALPPKSKSYAASVLQGHQGGMLSNGGRISSPPLQTNVCANNYQTRPSLSSVDSSSLHERPVHYERHVTAAPVDTSSIPLTTVDTERFDEMCQSMMLTAGGTRGGKPSDQPDRMAREIQESLLSLSLTEEQQAQLHEMSKAPGAERQFSRRRLEDGDSPPFAFDYEHKKLMATKAIQEKPTGEEGPRMPTDYWSGLGFSKSMPDSAARARLNDLFNALRENSNLLQTVNEDEEWSTDTNNNTMTAAASESSGFLANIDPTMLADSLLNSSQNGLVVGDAGSANVTGLPGMPRDLPTLLSSLDLSKYIDVFQQQEIDISTFLSMNEIDLKELGVTTFGARRKMLLAIDELRKLSATGASVSMPFRHHMVPGIGPMNGSLMPPHRLDLLATQSGRW